MPLSPTAVSALLSARPRTTRSDGRPAAVLIGLCELRGDPHVLLTRRSEQLRTHRGQYAFPGGARDPDDRSAEDTALREAFEEVGLRREDVTVLGALDDTLTISHFVVTPVVGWFRAPYVYTASEREVALVVELPLGAFVAGPEHHSLVVDGISRSAPGYRVGEHLVWGATARMMTDLVTVLAPLL